MTTATARTERPHLSPVDFLGVDASLSEDELLVRDTVRALVHKRILPGIEGWFERGEFPSELVAELGAAGLLGMHLDGYGCAGMSGVAYGLACLELEAADSGFRSFVSVQGSLVMFPIHAYGSEEQRQRWLPAMASGEAVGCFALTEPDAGSDPGSMRTTARRDGSDWIVSGTKMWITNGSIADVSLVWARTEEGVRGFLVPRETPGLSSSAITRKLSLRASVTSEIVLDECRLPEDAVLPGVVGMRGPLSCLDEARYGILWGVLGAARTCYETALSYAKERVQFGRSIASFQMTQQRLVEMMLSLEKGRLLALHLGRKKDEGTLRPEQVSAGKLNNVRMALRIAREARAILGANGITLEYPIMRHMTNLESVLTYEGTSEVHTLILGKAITGISSFA